MTDSASPTVSTDSRPPSCSNCKKLEYKLFVALRYIELLESWHKAQGGGYKPSQWDLSVQQLVEVLKSDDAYAALRKLHPNNRYTPPDELVNS
jgi:hypothetical protein